MLRILEIFRKNKRNDVETKHVTEDESSWVRGDVSDLSDKKADVLYINDSSHKVELAKPYEPPSDKEILEQLEFCDYYEAAFLIRDLKKQVKVLKTKLTKLENKYDRTTSGTSSSTP